MVGTPKHTTKPIGKKNSVTTVTKKATHILILPTIIIIITMAVKTTYLVKKANTLFKKLSKFMKKAKKTFATL